MFASLVSSTTVAWRGVNSAVEARSAEKVRGRMTAKAYVPSSTPLIASACDTRCQSNDFDCDEVVGHLATHLQLLPRGQGRAGVVADDGGGHLREGAVRVVVGVEVETAVERGDEDERGEGQPRQPRGGEAAQLGDCQTDGVHAESSFSESSTTVADSAAAGSAAAAAAVVRTMTTSPVAGQAAARLEPDGVVAAVPLRAGEDQDAHLRVHGAELEQQARADPCRQLLPRAARTVGQVVRCEERRDGRSRRRPLGERQLLLHDGPDGDGVLGRRDVGDVDEPGAQLQVGQVRDPADADPAPEQLDTAAEGEREGDLGDAGVGRDDGDLAGGRGEGDVLDEGLVGAGDADVVDDDGAQVRSESAVWLQLQSRYEYASNTDLYSIRQRILSS